MPDPATGLRIRHVLREDALGELLRAEDPLTGEGLCLRRMHAALASDEAARLLFAEEIRRIATLSHPSLLRVRRHDRAAPRPYFVTDPIDEGTLEDEVRETGAIGRVPARRLVVHLLGGLAQLEARRQLHAAILPSRLVRVGREPGPTAYRLTTFREIRADDEAPRMKGRDPVDARFAPPELAGSHPSDPRARSLTTYAVGALWRWLRTGLAPDAGAIPGVEDADAATIARWMAPEPDLRPVGAESLLARLAAGPDADGGQGPERERDGNAAR